MRTAIVILGASIIAAPVLAQDRPGGSSSTSGVDTNGSTSGVLPEEIDNFGRVPQNGATVTIAPAGQAEARGVGPGD